MGAENSFPTAEISSFVNLFCKKTRVPVASLHKPSKHDHESYGAAKVETF